MNYLNATQVINAYYDANIKESNEELISQNRINDLVKKNIKYVVSIAKKHTGYGVDFEDLVQCGIYGMIKALNNYNVKRGKFLTFAHIYIQKYITDEIAINGRSVRLPMNKVVENYYKNKSGEKVNVRDVYFYDEEGKDLLERLHGEIDETTKKNVEYEFINEQLSEAFKTLDDLDKQILTLYCGYNCEYPHPVDRIAEKLNIKTGKVRKILKKYNV